MPPCKKPAFTYFPTPQYPSDYKNDTLPRLAPISHTKPTNLVGQRHICFSKESADTGHCNVYMPSIPSSSAPVLPHPSEHQSNWNTDPPPSDNFYELYPFADPSYQHSLDVMDPDVAPRRRTKSVSHYVLLMLIGPSSSQLDA